MSLFAVCKRELRDLLSLWLLPGLAAVLPWRVCVRIYWWFSASRLILREEVSGSRGGRQTLGLDAFDVDFDRRFRFGFLLEHADLFRALGWGWRGLARTMPLAPESDREACGGLCFFFNFNQGLPALASLRANGYPVYLVYRRLDGRPAGVGWLRYGYMRLRLRMVARVCGNSGIGTGGARARIAEVIAAGGLVCVAADTPPRSGTGLVSVAMPGGRVGYWRSGVLKLALESSAPLRCFDIDLCWRTGMRQLRLRRLEPPASIDALAADLNGRFLDLYGRLSELWFYWPAPQGFFELPAASRVEPSNLG